MPPPNARLAAANAQIGIAHAAYYPNVSLSASGGFESSAWKHLLDWPSRFWSIGPSVSETVFDAGLRRATVNQYVATYNADLAGYRQTVLTAFQQVEDNLAALRILTQQIQQQHKAVESTKQALEMEMARYQTGVDPYIDVVTEQNALLSAQQSHGADRNSARHRLRATHRSAWRRLGSLATADATADHGQTSELRDGVAALEGGEMAITASLRCAA